MKSLPTITFSTQSKRRQRVNIENGTSDIMRVSIWTYDLIDFQPPKAIITGRYDVDRGKREYSIYMENTPNNNKEAIAIRDYVNLMYGDSL